MAEVQGEGGVEEEVEEEKGTVLMVRNSEMIPDFRLEEALEYLKIGRKERAELMCLAVDLNKSQDPLIPPYHWNGEGMKPLELVKLLFGKTRFNGINDVKEEFDKEKAGGDNMGENGGLRNKWNRKRDKLWELQEEVVKVYQEVTGMEIYDIVESRTTTVKNRWSDNRIHVLCCKKCGIEKRKNYPIIRLQYRSETTERNTYVYYLELLDCFFHYCEGKADVKRALEEKVTGHLVMKSDGSTWMEGIREKAFGGWVKTLHKYKDPEQELPPGTKVQFPSEKAVRDNRMMVELDEGLPEGMDENAEKYLKQYISWIIYKVVFELGIAREFTKYLPIPFEESDRRNGIRAGRWRCEQRNEESVPVHLYVDGLVLLFGGMALDEEGKLVKGNAEGGVVHQVGHVDFYNKRWKNCNKCEVLQGLMKPCSVNVAVEDKRDIYMVHPKNTVRILANDILVVGGNTVHGGITYVYKVPDEEEKETPRYHPSIHFVVQSKRYKKMKDSVGIPTQDVEAYTHKAHMADLANNELYVRIENTAEAFCELGREAYSEGRRKIAIETWKAGVRKIIKEVKELEGYESEGSESEDSEASGKEGSGNEGSEEKIEGKKRGRQKVGGRRSNRKRGKKEKGHEGNDA